MKRMPPGIPPSQRTGGSSDWRAKARKAVQILVHGMRSNPDRDPGSIRGEVIQAARDALGEKPGGQMKRKMALPTRDGRGSEVETMINAAGVFRLILVNEPIDRKDAMAAESFMEVVVGELDRVLDAA